MTNVQRCSAILRSISTFMLRSIFLISICSFSSAFAQGLAFSGVWGDEEGYVIYVKDKYVCGSWSYSATNRFYDGLFTGMVVGDQVIADRVCGTPGSFVKSFCPAEDTTTLSPMGWHSIRALARICHGRLIFLDDGKTFPEKCSADPTLGEGRSQGKVAERRMADLRDEILSNPEFINCR